ncbi:MAG: DUF4336 domain-containing protein [Gammaproteobacteria bacterium]|nr:DUF4336 domain-containing protein [Gammaproteobacteria bacterium]
MRQVDEGLWVCEKSFSLLGVDIGNRMTLIDVADGRLFIHSPISLDGSVRDAVRRLGVVSWIVTPNRCHGMYVGDWLSAFPGARYFAAPGARIKVQGYAEPLAECHSFQWGQHVQVVAVNGVPKLNEYAFFHRPSRTLLLTDLAFNLPKNTGWWPQMMLRANNSFGTFGPSRMLRGMVEDAEQFRASLEKILDWDFDRIVMSHGAMVMKDGKSLMTNAFADFLNASAERHISLGLRSELRCG